MATEITESHGGEGVLGAPRLIRGHVDSMAENVVREGLRTIVQEIMASRRVVSDAARLYHDLFISGDDAAHLLDKVHKIYGTRFDGFHFDSYFPDEAEAWMCHFARLLGLPSRRSSFTFGHLVRVVMAGRWMEPSNPHNHRNWQNSSP